MVQEAAPHPRYPRTIEEVKIGQRLMFYPITPTHWNAAICLNVQDGYPVDDKHEFLSEIRVYCNMGKIEKDIPTKTLTWTDVDGCLLPIIMIAVILAELIPLVLR